MSWRDHDSTYNHEVYPVRYCPVPVENARCFLAQFSDRPCEGRLVRCHLVPKQMLKRERLSYTDPRTWVPGCGGIVGNAGHHGMLDHSRTLRIPRAALPEGLEEFCAEYGLSWWLTREYGPLEMAT